LKKTAWVWLSFLILERLNRAKGLRYDKSDGTSADVHHIPLRVEISDDIYANTFSLNVSWWLFTTTTLLFRSTGMFDAVGVQGLTWENHRRSLDDQNITADNIVREGLGLKDDRIVDICNQPPSTSSAQTSRETPKSGVDALLAADMPEKKDSVVDYKNDVTLEIDNDTYYHNPMKDGQEPVEEQIRDKNEYENIPWLMPIPDGPSPSEKEIKGQLRQKPSRSTYRVIMKGFGVRIGFSMTAPNLESYGGMKAFKVGTDVITERKMAISPVITGGRTRKVPTLYRLDWEKTYVLDGVPDGMENPAKTDGVPEQFA
jgi:hypothetical protein